MDSEHYILQEKIQNFATGNLDTHSRDTLLGQAEADPELADELAFGRSLVMALRHKEWAEANAVLKAAIATEGFPPPPPMATRWSFWAAWAGGTVLLILLFGAVYWLPGRNNTQAEFQVLAQNALKPLENVLLLPDSGAPSLKQGMTAYDAGLYQEASRLLDAYTKQRPEAAAKVYLGVSLLMSGRAKAAIKPLADATESPEPPVQEAAQWYLALAYIETGKVREAQEILGAMPKDGLFFAQAQDILNDIRQLK